MRQLCGLAIAVLAAIGLSAPLASAVTVPVINGTFETEYGAAAVGSDNTTNWVKLTNWTHENTNTGSVPITGAFSSSADGGSNFTRFTWNNSGAEQNLNTSAAVGDTLSVTFNFGRATNRWGGSDNTGVAYFKIGSNYYYQDCDVSSHPVGTWKSFTFTHTATTAGALSLGFRVARHTNNNQYVSLDGVSDVTLTPATNDPNAPTSTNATLAALENTATPLAAGDFGYADPNSSALAAVQITAVPTLGTLTYIGTPVANNDIIAAADIGNLSYLSPLGGFGSPYTTIGIKVQNATDHWSLPATMTVNVTHVNHAPTSSGSSVVLRKNTVKTFAAADFQFSDIDAGDTLQAIKVTSLPAGTLTLNGTPITSAPSADILVADIGTLTYTPNTDYTGSDLFNFQVRDAALFSADATMAITVTPGIPVLNGGFETPTPHNPNNGTNADWTAGGWAFLPAPWTSSYGGPYNRISSAAMVGTAQPGPWICNLNGPIWIKQDLGSSVNAGDTISVTFQLMSDNLPGEVTAEFQVGTGPTVYSETFTSPQNNGVWVTYTLTKTVGAGVSGKLVLKLTNTGVAGVNDRSWLDNISNVSVTTGSGPTPGSFADWALTNAPGQDPSQDYNNDGVQNGVAYFMGVTGLATNPGPDASNTVTWPMSATFSGTAVVQISPDLGIWTPASPQPTPSGGNLTYTLPPGAPGGKSFVRLLVTPN